MKFLRINNELINFNEFDKIYNNGQFLIFKLKNKSIYFDDENNDKYIFVQAFLQDDEFFIYNDFINNYK